MIKYRTDLRIRYEGFKIVKESNLSITYIDAKGNKKNDLKNGKEWNWHDTEIEAIEHLERREKNLIETLEYQINEAKIRLNQINDLRISLIDKNMKK